MRMSRDPSKAMEDGIGKSKDQTLRIIIEGLRSTQRGQPHRTRYRILFAKVQAFVLAVTEPQFQNPNLLYS